MTIKVFTGPGALEKLQGKKSTLSNKALTRSVRALRGKEGQRSMVSQNLLNGITLAANTAQIFYMTTLNSLDSVKIHSVRYYVRWQSIINSANRLIVFEDIRAVQGNAVVADILDVATDVFSAIDPTVWNYGVRRGSSAVKNFPDISRIRILKDTLWTDAEPVATVDVIKTMIFTINFHGRKSKTGLQWGVLVMSDKSNTPIDIQYLVDHTSGLGN